MTDQELFIAADEISESARELRQACRIQGLTVQELDLGPLLNMRALIKDVLSAADYSD